MLGFVSGFPTEVMGLTRGFGRREGGRAHEVMGLMLGKFVDDYTVRQHGSAPRRKLLQLRCFDVSQHC
jgi:hypothetical protein